MTVYALAQLRFTDRAAYDRYQSRFMGVLKKFSGQLLVADETPKVLEGEWRYDKLVVLSFPDVASFEAWSQSADYQAILIDRKAGATADVILARGIHDKDRADMRSTSA